MSVLTLIETICPKITAKPLPENAGSPLLVDVRCSKTSLLELPNVSPLGLLKSNDRARSTSSLFFLPQERRPYAIECTFPQNQRVIAVATEVNRTSNENQSRPFKEFI